MISGPAGIGKSSLLRHFASEAEANGWRIGWGLAAAADGAPPLSAWHDAIGNLDARQAAALVQDAHTQDRGAMFRSMSTWLNDRADDGAILVVLEDLHDADQSTIELLGYIGRRPMSPNLLIVASSRTDLGPEAPRGNVIALQGMTESEAQQLAASVDANISGENLTELVERTNGNPFFLQRLIEQGSQGGLPPDVRSILDEQLDTLTDEQRLSADILSVIGNSATRQLFRRVAQKAKNTDHVAVPSAAVEQVGDEVCFVHSLFRESIYDALSQQERATVHAACADVLRADGENPSVVAHHLSRAAKNDDGIEAAIFASEAGRIALRIGAWPEALEQFSSVVSIRRDLGESEELALALVDKAVALAQARRVTDAETHLLNAAAINGLSDATKMLIVREYGRVRWHEEPNPTSLNAARLRKTAQSLLGDSTDPAMAAVYETGLVAAADIVGMTPDALEHADLAVAHAIDSGDMRLIGEAHVARRRALRVHHGVLEQRVAASRKGAAAAGECNDRELLARAQRLALCDAMAAGDRSEVIRHIEVVEQLASTGFREQQALWRAELASIEGRFADATDILQEASKELTYLGVDAPALDYIQVVHAWHRGELSSALAEFEPLLAIVGDAALSIAVALGKLIDGDANVAQSLAEPCLEELFADEAVLLWATIASISAEIVAALDHPAVQQMFDCLLPYEGQCSVPAAAGLPWIGSFDRHLGLLSIRLGELDRGIELLKSGLAVESRMHARPWVARSHAALEMAYRMKGTTDLSSFHGRKAAEIADELQLGDVLLLGDWPTGPTVLAGPRSQHAAELIRIGSTWQVGLNGVGGTIAHGDGMDYLSKLIGEPQTDWHVLDLYGLANAAAFGSSSAGVALDNQARAAYQDRYRDLSVQLDEAKANNDNGQVESLSQEVEMLEQQLLSAFGLGGRSRNLADPTERARVNVRRAISRALSRIDEVAPLLGDHLRARVQTGRFCRYTNDPVNPVVWERAKGT